jgi:hypothetical protein
MTGRAKEQMAKAQAQEIQEKFADTSMANAAQAEEERSGVFDAKSGERIDAPGAHEAVVVEEPKPSFGGRQSGEPVLSGKESPEAADEAAIAGRRAAVVAQASDVEVLKNAMVTIRLDSDVEEMTYGMVNGEPNNYNFKEGLAYRVPLAVAEHLQERRLIRQWIG